MIILINLLKKFILQVEYYLIKIKKIELLTIIVIIK